MKQSPVNLELQFKQPYIKKLAFLRKFLRYWETTSVYDRDSGQNVEVFVGRKYYYKRSRMSDSTEKLLKMFKIYNDLNKQDMKGVTKAWVYLNARKEEIPSFSKTIIAENLDLLFDGKEYVNVRLVLGTKSLVGRGLTAQAYPISSDISDITAVSNELAGEYRSQFLAGYSCEVKGLKLDGTTTVQVSPYERLLGRYILGSDDVEWEITKVKVVQETIPIQNTSYYFDDNLGGDTPQYYYTYEKVDQYVIDIKVPNYGFSNTTDVVVQMGNDGEADHSNVNDGNLIVTRQLLNIPLESYKNDEDDDFPADLVNYQPPGPDVNHAFWVYDWDDRSWGGWLLRKDVLTGNTLTLDQKLELINAAIDIGYKEKTASAMDKFVGLVIVAAAIYVGFLLFGPTGAFKVAETVTPAVLAAVFSFAAIAVSIAALAAEGMGREGLATALGSYARTLGVMASILAVISMINAGADYSKAAVEATRELTMEEVVQKVIDEVLEEMQDLFTKELTDLSFSQYVKMTNTLFGLWSENQQATVQSKIKDAKDKNARLSQAKEEQQASNPFLQFAKIQFSLMRMDYSFYESLYDKPYEGWMSAMHTGNIQRTEVFALYRLDDVV